MTLEEGIWMSTKSSLIAARLDEFERTLDIIECFVLRGGPMLAPSFNISPRRSKPATKRTENHMARYLLTGATGNLGGLTLEALLKAVPAAEISVLARNPAKAKGLEARGVKVIKGDYFDYESLVDAFGGVDKLLLIGAVSLTNRPPQHANMIRAIQTARPKHVVYVGVHRKEGSKIKLREVTDVEIKSEKDLADSGVDYTIVRNPLYAQAFKQLLGGNIKDDGVRAFGPEGRTTYADIRDLGQANANLLTQDGHRNKIYHLNAGEALTLRDMAGLWGELYGKPIPYIHLTKQEFIEWRQAKGLSLEQAEYTTEFLNAVAEGEFSQTSDALRTILGRRPMSLKETFASDL
jgi:NAD(P)H dehydrogenase (quinone)